jgi:hypothetical protein
MPAVSLTAPSAIVKVDPKYARKSCGEKLEGVVILFAILRKDVTIDGESVRVIRKLDSRLDLSAREALLNWKLNRAKGTESRWTFKWRSAFRSTSARAVKQNVGAHSGPRPGIRCTRVDRRRRRLTFGCLRPSLGCGGQPREERLGHLSTDRGVASGPSLTKLGTIS